MFGNSPFLGRVVLLLALMALFAGYDRWRHGAAATRWREYAFILTGGMLGGLVGACNDWFTSGISPEYFSVGKGLEGENVRAEAVILGLKTGFSAGIIGGAVALFACGKARGTWSHFYTQLWMPVAGAICGGLVVQPAASHFDPAGLLPQLNELLVSEQATRFLRVWWTHTGLYAGLLIGLVAMIVNVRRCKANARASSECGSPLPLC